MVVSFRLIGAPDHVFKAPLETGVTGVGVVNGVAGQEIAAWVVEFDVRGHREYVVLPFRPVPSTRNRRSAR